MNPKLKPAMRCAYAHAHSCTSLPGNHSRDLQMGAAAAAGDRLRTTVCWFLCILARFLPQAWHMIFVWAGDSTNMWIAWRSPDCNGLGDRCALRPWPWHAWDTFRCAGSPHQELQSGRLTRFAPRNSTQHQQDGLGFGPGSRLQPAPRPGSSLRSEDADSLGAQPGRHWRKGPSSSDKRARSSRPPDSIPCRALHFGRCTAAETQRGMLHPQNWR